MGERVIPWSAILVLDDLLGDALGIVNREKPAFAIDVWLILDEKAERVGRMFLRVRHAAEIVVGRKPGDAEDLVVACTAGTDRAPRILNALPQGGEVRASQAGLQELQWADVEEG